jgi:hypothetical protein
VRGCAHAPPGVSVTYCCACQASATRRGRRVGGSLVSEDCLPQPCTHTTQQPTRAPARTMAESWRRAECGLPGCTHPPPSSAPCTRCNKRATSARVYFDTFLQQLFLHTTRSSTTTNDCITRLLDLQHTRTSHVCPPFSLIFFSLHSFLASRVTLLSLPCGRWRLPLPPCRRG